ncbi:MAG: PadR family transcriptional regulator [Clostridia bacterium]|nr:PadR family transcriptional regulator [Clostridia bacterium]
MNIQFKKGVLELCVLSLLHHGEMYGYELTSKLSEAVSISDGTIYPLLRRMKTEGYVTTYLSESNEGPPRKYYKLTETGMIYKDKLITEWIALSKGVNRLIEGGTENE